MRKQIDPYVAKLSTFLSGWPFCCVCGVSAKWRVNTTGIDGEGFDVCVDHAREVLSQVGNEQLLFAASEHGLFE